MCNIKKTQEMSQAKTVVSAARQAYNKNLTKPIEWRINQLQRLHDLLTENQDALVKAVHKDLRKPSLETIIMEIVVTKNEITHAIANVHQWAKPTYVNKTMLQKLDTLYIQKQPLGVALVMGAWNYPILLLLTPFVGAIAAGNCCVLKPSDLSATTSKLMAELFPKYLDSDCYPVYQAGIPGTTELLEEKFDYIFYTGGGTVGKIVMAAATKHLTPVTLELGGKSPVYVHDDCDFDIVSSRIAWGKWVNAGQTCTAADYILCHQDVVDQFCTKLKKTIVKMYGENPKESPDFARIVNERNFKRICGLMEGMDRGKLVAGGETDVSELYIAPTIYRDVKMDDSIMSGEIFGPILPIIAVSGPQQAIEIINNREKPLALYIFANSTKVADNILENTSSGGTMVNDLLMHVGATNLPFGGVGQSGMGNYHGKHAFDTFTHERSVWRRKQNMEAMVAPRYPPYTEKNTKNLEWLLTEKRGSFCNIL